MVVVIRIFGIISIVVAVVVFLISLSSVFLVGTLLPLAASALLGGALLLAFARVVELLEEMNAQLKPIHTIALALQSKYAPSAPQGPIAMGSFDPNNPIVDPLANLPAGSQIERHFRRRVAFLPDDSVIGETDGGPRPFASFDEWRKFIRE